VGRLRIARDNTPHGRGFRGTDELWLVVVPFHRLRTAMLCCDNITLMIEQYRACGVLYVSNPLTSRMYFVLDFVPIAGTGIFLSATIVPSFLRFALEYRHRGMTEKIRHRESGRGWRRESEGWRRNDFAPLLSIYSKLVVRRWPAGSHGGAYGNRRPLTLGEASAHEISAASTFYVWGLSAVFLRSFSTLTTDCSVFAVYPSSHVRYVGGEGREIVGTDNP